MNPIDLVFGLSNLSKKTPRTQARAGWTVNMNISIAISCDVYLVKPVKIICIKNFPVLNHRGV